MSGASPLEVSVNMQAVDTDLSPVCGEPKIFVGQLPTNATEENVMLAFSTYGHIEQMTVPKKPDGKPRGFAMLRYKLWAHAEAAIDSENGKFSLGGDRPLVVKFADPPKVTKDGSPGSGITPKKLFVGQVRCPCLPPRDGCPT